MKNKVMNKKLLIAVLSMSIIAGCKQNPYTSVPATNNTPTKTGTTEKVVSVEAPFSLTCTESENCSTVIRGHVPAPGEAIVEFKGLPAGATYDAAKGTLNYNPGFNVVDIAKNPNQTVTSFDVEIIVRSTADDSVTSNQTLTILVYNKMQPLNLKVTGSANVDEGSTLEQTVEVESKDFPKGPFSLSAINAPVGTTVEAEDETTFTVRFKPGFSFTGVNDRENLKRPDSYYSKDVKVTYNVSLPIGQSSQKDVTWTVNDVRQNPSITAPDSLTQGLDVNFSIRAEDMNGENPPKITVNSSVPFGRLTTTTLLETSSVAYPSKVVQVRWDQLKLSNLGTVTPINYEVCVQRFSGSSTMCTSKKVMVTLKADVHPAPIISHDIYKTDAVNFTKFDSGTMSGMPIVDGEDAKLPVDVKVTSNQPGAVSWKTGYLWLSPKEEGLLQFTITAESIYGRVTTESFLVEVLPKAWAKTVMPMSDSVQNESAEMAKLMDSVDLLSLKFQVSAHSMALRESCAITTDALSSSMLDEKIQNTLHENVSSVLVSSPLATNLKGKMAAQLKKWGVKTLGRLSVVAPQTNISSLTLAVNPKATLQSPAVPAGLKGALTKESANPLLFDIASLSNKCVPLFNLQKPAFSAVVGVSCTEGEKTITVLGFELADVLMDAGDAPLLKSWMNVFLTGKAK